MDESDTFHKCLLHYPLQLIGVFCCFFGKVITLFAIRITRPCDKYPLIPHFYIVKLGFRGVYIIFLFLL